ncbi:MAG: YebC/PmpR family DNA-binding transcriptional regulator [Planctomycetota bacterium]
MAGHSHWANIKHKKAANDAKKAAVITRMGKLIKGAIQVGGPDPDMNPRLRLAIAKARAANMVKDAIDRIIKKATGESDDKPIEELVYEGYAAAGVAVVVETMTDNRNRTAPEIRKLFERAGGNMGAPGCVAWQFKQVATFLVTGADEDRVMEVLLEADCDADDIAEADTDTVSINAPPDQYDAIRQALEAAGLTIEQSDITKLPDNEAPIDDLATAQRIQKFLDQLDEHEDVTEVYTNFAPTPSVATAL